MDIFVYSDESGVFDKVHNELFVYGGLILFGKEQMDEYTRRYLAAERAIRGGKYSKDRELKACTITNAEKGKLFRSINRAISFGVMIRQRAILDRIFFSKKDKQRYLDYAYKIGLKSTLIKLIEEGIINPKEVRNIHIFCDEHSTATNGRYELGEALEQEFKLGTYNMNYNHFFPPLFEGMGKVRLYFRDSQTTPLIRAADIIANRIYFNALNKRFDQLQKIYLHTLP